MKNLIQVTLVIDLATRTIKHREFSTVTFLRTIIVPLQLKFFIALIYFFCVCVVSELLHIMMHYVMLTSTYTLLYAVSAI